jgi:hypothetical protein
VTIEGGERSILSVCDVLANDPTKLNGKVLSMKGPLVLTNERVWLAGDCTSHLITQGHSWDNRLLLYVDHGDEKLDHSWRSMLAKEERLHAAPRNRMWVTLVARLETLDSMEDAVVQRPYGAAPAELNVISVADVTIERSEKRR